MTRTSLFAAAVVLATVVSSPTSAQEIQAKDARAKAAEAAGLSRAKGAENATVRIYEIADFQCPFCARFATEQMAKIDSAFIKTGKVQWVFVNLPLPMHPNAWAASEAAMCAGSSNKFWPMHDKLYMNQAEWSAAADPATLFTRYAREVGVPAGPFATCVASDLVATLITNDIIFAASSRITGTPTFVINDEEVIVGVKTFEEWRDIIDAAAKKAATKKD